MAYQSFGESGGSSDSQGKLAALRWDRIRPPGAQKDMQGLHVLDIGCNEGFFCLEALNRGAASATGVDKSSKIITEARKRCPRGEFINGTWWDIPDRKFDVILFLSALHYEEREKDLFDFLADHLSPNGTLILECGVIRTSANLRGWRQVQRGDGPKRYALLDFLIEDVLSRFAVREMGASVMQKGDLVPRYVFHCSLRKPSAVLVKNVTPRTRFILSNSFANKSINSYSADELLLRIKDSTNNFGLPHFHKLKSTSFGSRHVNQLCEFLIENNLVTEFAKIVAMECPSNIELFVVDGECLKFSEINIGIQAALENLGVACWQIEDFS